MATIGQRLLSDVFNDARIAILNDSAADVFSDSLLLAAAAQIIPEIEDEFAKYGIAFNEVIDTTLTYTANQTSISLGATIPGIIDMPLEVWQRFSTSDEWLPTRFTDRLKPDPPSASYPMNLTFWEWRRAADTAGAAGSVLAVNACSRNMLLMLRYRKHAAYQAAASNVVGFDWFYWPLVYGVSWLGLAGREHPVAVVERCERMYRKRTFDAIQKFNRELQKIPRSPIPYRRPRGRAGLRRFL